MNRSEIRVVKRQLEGYLDYLELAKQAEEKAAELEKRYEAMAGLRCVPLTKNDSGKNSGMKPDHTSRFLEIFGEQDELLKQAETYRAKAWRIQKFISEAIPEDKRQAFKSVYLNGFPVKVAALGLNCTESSVRKVVDSALLAVSSAAAKKFGLL